MKSALIGYTGFVGSTLLKQRNFDDLYRSSNIQDIRSKAYDLVVCAGAPAQKWLANAKPIEDEQNIDQLISHLDQVQAKKFILISTVDVFLNPVSVNEETKIVDENLHVYGKNRRKLEKFVEGKFSEHLIVRLPGLVGPGLKKNIIFDFLNNNNLDKIESRSVFQFYPMVNLWSDLNKYINARKKLVHLTAEPLSVSEIALEAFNLTFKNELSPHPAVYDFQTVHSDTRYQYSKQEALLAIRAYAQSEMKKVAL